jgi:flagellar biosynthesis/type III secretory pathway protein FliH
VAGDAVSSKTPEEMTEEWVSKNTTGSETYEHGLRNGFLAGYHVGYSEGFEFCMKMHQAVAEHILKTQYE